MSQKNFKSTSSKQIEPSLKTTTKKKEETQSPLYYKWGKLEIHGPSSDVKWALKFHCVTMLIALMITALLIFLFFPKGAFLSVLLKFLKGWISRLILFLVLVEPVLLFSG